MRTSLFVSLLFIANSLGGVTSSILGINSFSLILLTFAFSMFLDAAEVYVKLK